MDMVVQRLGDGVAAAVFQMLAVKPGSGPRVLAGAGACVCCMSLVAAQVLGSYYNGLRSKAKQAAAAAGCHSGTISQ